MQLFSCTVNCLLKSEDVFPLLIAKDDIAGAAAQIEMWLIVVCRGCVLWILEETKFAFIQYAVQIHPRSAAKCKKGRAEQVLVSKQLSNYYSPAERVKNKSLKERSDCCEENHHFTVLHFCDLPLWRGRRSASSIEKTWKRREFWLIQTSSGGSSIMPMLVWK